MLNFDVNKANMVASDTQAVLADIDDAIGSAAGLTQSFIEAVRGSNMPAHESQKLIQALHESAGSVLAGRAGLVNAITLLTSFKRRSNQSETSFGCPGEEPWVTGLDRQPLRVVAV